MRVVAYVTPKYYDHGHRLEDNLADLGLPHNIQFKDDWDSKRVQMLWKPFFLMEMFDMFPGEDLALVDGDSFFVKAPPEINLKNDVGIIKSAKFIPNSFWMTDAFRLYKPTRGAKAYVGVCMKLCNDPGFKLSPSTNHARTIAAYYLSRRTTSFGFIDLGGSFKRNYKQSNERTY